MTGLSDMDGSPEGPRHGSYRPGGLEAGGKTTRRQLMHKSLSPSAFGISGRQSELIELALTHGYGSLEIDIDELLRKAEKQSIEHAARFLTSAQLTLGSFELPIDWRGSEGPYKAGLSKLDELGADLVKAGARVCHVTIEPASDALPYHENFELHRQRLAEIGQVLAKHGIRLGLALVVAPSHRENHEFQFIHDTEALVTLVKSIGEDNVGVYLDTWNWHFGGGTPEQVRELDGKIVAMSFADAPSDAQADTISESQRILPDENGQIDNKSYLRVAAEAGFEGPATVAPHVDSLSGNREAVVRQCGSVLDSLSGESEQPEQPEAPADPDPAPALSP